MVTLNCSRRGSHLVQPLCYGVVLLCECRHCRVLCFVPELHGCVLVCLRLCKEAAITERRDMGMYEVPLSMCLLGFGMGTMLANFHMCGIMLSVKSSFSTCL